MDLRGGDKGFNLEQVHHNGAKEFLKSNQHFVAIMVLFIKLAVRLMTSGVSKKRDWTCQNRPLFPLVLLGVTQCYFACPYLYETLLLVLLLAFEFILPIFLRVF